MGERLALKTSDRKKTFKRLARELGILEDTSGKKADLVNPSRMIDKLSIITRYIPTDGGNEIIFYTDPETGKVRSFRKKRRPKQ